MNIDKIDPKLFAGTLKVGKTLEKAKKGNPLKFYMWNTVDGRVIVLQAATEIEREQWYRAIDSAITAAKQAAKGTPAA